ncbi:M12 family metallo-peptidase [Streptomyces sp. NPDC007117]|uniref:M12 family metallo-peptidase n=1 Tax=Streptomyces sp. NPDC007117 TaxID=3154314 RepID=UPI0033EFDFE3
MHAHLVKAVLATGIAASLCAAAADAPATATTAGPAAESAKTASCPVVDVLVLYTPKAARRVGGAHRVPASAQRIATRMNRSLAGGGLCGVIRVVHPRTVPGYEGPEEFRAAHALLKDHTSAGIGRRAHEERARYGADLVTLVVDRPERGGGTADYTPALDSSTDEYAYAVVDVDGIDLDSASHEIGHNLGLAHDRRTLAGNPDGSMSVSRNRPYNTGWITRDGTRYTIMAYRSACGSHCRRVSRFSSATGTWQGHRLGDADSDGVRVLRETMPIVAGYRTKG